MRGPVAGWLLPGQQVTLPLLPLLLLLLLLLCGQCAGHSKCFTCDNYFELNMRNVDQNSKANVLRRYCSVDTFLTNDNHADCNGVDYNGCVKIVTRSYRHHIDRVGIGMRRPETLISTVVTRDCADIPPGMGVGCHMLYGAGSTTEMCYCTTEYCNSGVGWRAWRLLPMLLLVLVAISAPVLDGLW